MSLPSQPALGPLRQAGHQPSPLSASLSQCWGGGGLHRRLVMGSLHGSQAPLGPWSRAVTRATHCEGGAGMRRHRQGRVGRRDLCQAGLASGAGGVPDELSDKAGRFPP